MMSVVFYVYFDAMQMCEMEVIYVWGCVHSSLMIDFVTGVLCTSSEQKREIFEGNEMK